MHTLHYSTTVATPGAGAVDRGAVFSNLLELQQQTLNSLNDSQRAAVVNFITAPNDSLHVVQVSTHMADNVVMMHNMCCQRWCIALYLM
jgi:hypothetical protein